MPNFCALGAWSILKGVGDFARNIDDFIWYIEFYGQMKVV